ncbi:MAG: hypothetical protein ABSG84_10760 [Acidobacteriaceae bacterium]
MSASLYSPGKLSNRLSSVTHEKQFQRKGKVMTASKVRLALYGSALLCSFLVFPAVGQVAPVQQSAQIGQAQRQPPIEHYYWHFLLHQNELDNWAAAQAAKGYDSSAVRNHFQVSLGFSDADYSLIRASSVRLATEVKALSAQAAAIKAAGQGSTSNAQLNALSVTREKEIKAEVAYLRDNLSPEKIALLEAVMVHFFSPPNGAARQTPPAQQAAPAVVQP